MQNIYGNISMKTPFGCLLVALVAGVVPMAHADTPADYPDRTITITVPYTPGGTTDFLARRLAQVMSNKLEQSVIVENRPGAGTAVAASYVSRQSPDGYHLLVASNATLAVNPYLGIPLSYSPDDFEPVALLITVPNVAVSRPDPQRNTLAAWFDQAKDKPNTVSYGSMGVGTSNHIGMEVLLKSTNTEMLHVPYKGSAPALNDLMGGHVDIVVDTLVATLPHIKAGKMQPLAVLSSTGPSLIEIPTATEAVDVNVDLYSWFGLVAPKETPAEIVAFLNKTVIDALNDNETRKALEEVGVEIIGSTQEEFTTFINEQYSMYGRLIEKHSLSIAE